MAEGICPKCGSDKLDYHDSEEQDNCIFYKFECDDCHATGKEWYTVNYLESVLDKYLETVLDKKEGEKK